jgi:hypothetical protein
MSCQALQCALACFVKQGVKCFVKQGVKCVCLCVRGCEGFLGRMPCSNCVLVCLGMLCYLAMSTAVVCFLASRTYSIKVGAGVHPWLTGVCVVCWVRTGNCGQAIACCTRCPPGAGSGAGWLLAFGV